MVAVLFARRLTWTRARVVVVSAVVVAVGMGALFVPGTAGGLTNGAHGDQALVLEVRVISDWRAGVVPQPDGTVLFWGVAKKALAQSLPWLGVLAGLAAVLWSSLDRRAYAVLLI